MNCSHRASLGECGGEREQLLPTKRTSLRFILKICHFFSPQRDLIGTQTSFMQSALVSQLMLWLLLKLQVFDVVPCRCVLGCTNQHPSSGLHPEWTRFLNPRGMPAGRIYLYLPRVKPTYIYVCTKAKNSKIRVQSGNFLQGEVTSPSSQNRDK